MSITDGFSDLSAIHSLSYDVLLTLVIAEVKEVYPAAPAPGGGSRQELRIAGPDGRGTVTVLLFDQSTALLQRQEGSILRFSCSPTAKRAIVWERAKAVNPRLKQGVLVVRKQARVEVFDRNQLHAAGITSYGFRRSEGEPISEFGTRQLQAPQPCDVPAASALPTAAGTGATPASLSPAIAPGVALTIAQRFAECLRAAQSALGPNASAADVQCTARVTFEQMYGRPPAAAA